MTRRLNFATLTCAMLALGALGFASPAGATTTTRLYLDGSAAFSVLGHSCGGIRQQVYANGFGAGGYPTGYAYLQTSCGGSGRGGGYHSTTYSAWASVIWDWLGDTRAYTGPIGPPSVNPTFTAVDPYGDHLYNANGAAYLGTSSPPLVPPAPPSGVTATLYGSEVGEQIVMRFLVGWTPAAETARLITSATVTATPVGSSASVLSTTVGGAAYGAYVGPLQPSTTYRITVTNTDREGTSEPSSAVEARTPGADEAPGD